MVGPGETSRVRLTVTERALRHWDKQDNRWTIERGEIEILVGASSRDIRLGAVTTL